MIDITITIRKAELTNTLKKLSDEEQNMIQSKQDELLQLAPLSEKQPFNPCKIAVIFEDKTKVLLENIEKFRIAIEKQLQEELGSLTLLDRGKYIKILDANIEKLKLTPANERKSIEILTPDYLLTVGVVDYSEETLPNFFVRLFHHRQDIYIRCVNVDNTILIDSDWTTYEKDKRILKKSLFEKLKMNDTNCE